MMLTADDKKIFAEQGVLALRGSSSPKLVATAKASIVAELKRLKLLANGKITAGKIYDLPIFQQTNRLSQLIGSMASVDQLFSEDLLAIMDELAESNMAPAQPHSQILLSLPQKTEWSLNDLNWHLDLKVPKLNQISGIQAFILIDDVQAEGGATLALAGSHKLHYISHDSNAHGILKNHTEFNSFPEKFLKQSRIEGVPVQIVEMSGRAGDIYLMDLRVLHTPSVNSSRNIRMMATNRYLKKSSRTP